MVGPQHTFNELAVAIDLAFARWDLGHLCEFEFQDGRRIGFPDPEYGQEVIDYREAMVSKLVKKGDRFTYLFDLGDQWLHRCMIMATNVDPERAFGIIPQQPVPIWGWGWIPDQHGRRTENGDDER
ncbi:MAG: IS1096 element passenger TnpR family protein [Mycobacterium leprae]